MKEDVLIDLLKRTGKQSRSNLIVALNFDKESKRPYRLLSKTK